MASHFYCDGVRRRDFLRLGAVTSLGLHLPGFLRGAAAGQINGRATAKAAIFIQLSGGPSHMDSFDLKPGAPETHRGEFDEIPTNVPGIRISEHLPKLANCADKYAILRGVSHTLAAHELGTKYMLTGNRPLPSLTFPGYGAVVARELPAAPDLPPFVAIPSTTQDGGYLGPQYNPLRTGSTPRAGQKFAIRGLDLTQGLTVEDIDKRHNLLSKFDNAFGSMRHEDELLAGLDEFGQRAYQMIRSPKSREAFDISRESPHIANLFGKDSFSQSCLLAVRLIESGVRFTTVQLGGWDTHQDNFARLKARLLPELDAGLSGLFNALHAKGMLGETIVFVTGEFGRTPRINNRGGGGRDHYPRAMFCVMAGGGIKGGQVIGESDERGEGPKSRAIAPDDVATSFYHALGIDSQKEYHTPTGRPVMIVRDGKRIPELFA